MISLGIDPDTAFTGMALVDHDKVLAIGGTSSPSGFMSMCQRIRFHIRQAMLITGRIDVVVVEGQQVYRKGRVDANGLLKVAMVTGAALGATEGCDRVFCPKPREWKGNRPKGVDQKATLRHYGWAFKDLGPERPPLWEVPAGLAEFGDPIPLKHKKEVADAMGLALWGLNEA